MGMGRMGERVAIAARGLGHEVVRVFDVMEDAYGFRDPNNKAVATSDLASFWSTDLDMVAIATYGPTHCPLVHEGIKAGHQRFMVEKPVCTSMNEGEELLAAVWDAGARVVVNHGRRYCRVYDELLRMDGSPEMGPLRAATLTMGAGGLGCMGTHFFDLFARVLGEPTHAFAQLSPVTATNPRGAEFDDPGVTGILGFGQRRAMIEMCDDLGIPGMMEFLYQNGRVVIENELQPWRVMARREEDRALPVTRYGMPLVERPLEPFEPCEIIFATSGAVRDALSDDEPICGLGTGLRAFEMFAALRWSARTGEVVRFPLPDDARAARYSIS